MVDSSTKRVLMVITSHADLGNTGEKTGFWVEEFAAPYYAFVDAGVQVTLASPAGGQPPVDPKSELADFQTPSTHRFDADSAAKALVANTAKLADMNAADYDAVFYPGGHGPLWDLPENTDSIALIEDFLTANKPAAAVCHATAAFLNIKDSDGEYVVKGKVITGFTNSEEEAVQLTDVVPFLLEDELVKRGGEFQKVADWSAFAVQDGLLITGQNPASSELAAKKLLAALSV
ncbi:MAG: putative intracellular protease/amidase [Gammaproteobacteria bacterium]|jgi:putative intracellular protease/amidase|uniref:type 1 glutamine amidotransferase domain-containing protein n=2 Tax=Oceanospirillaceae TaxID=135620 RepID=UPI0009492840|nr:type 1 glutamine amidotransferase domain-containing protein [Thalassolituus oleivorans]APR68588.1 type 1 glutamine amidotransferase domain-containing protein [Thalassolituus oleivorans]MCA6126777.1 dimethylallyltransferase [Thalassolituus oleivorans 4BN06-13]PHQ83866.1 MAG: type 1 glutamine amidotransferase domain-containing protein [Thalassobium sp.]PHQ84309.1 MAG: type 1 glutamine amidotransferase domain-containing protein [Thalassobium sp.]|tara:strand:+ start:4469 stop:5167 length:699 start_codon:yes stop_codon:yes gene_type:complete